MLEAKKISFEYGCVQLKEALAGIGRLEVSILVLFPVLFAGFFFMETQLHRLVLYVLFVLYLAFCIRERRVPESSRDRLLWLTLGTFLGFSFISCFWSFDADWARTLQKLKVAPFIAVFVFAFADMIRRRPILWQICLDAFIGTALVTGLLLLLANYELFWGLADGARLRGWGQAENPVQCSLLYGLALVLLLFSKPHLLRPLNSGKVKVFVALLFLTIMVLTVSRGPLIALALTVFSCFLLWRDWKKVAAILVLGVAALGIFATQDTDFASIKERGDGYRFQVWDQVLQKFSESPIVGYGAAHKFYYDVSRANESTSQISHPHSLYFSTLMQTGLIGLALLGSCIVVTAWRSYRLFRGNRDFACLLIFEMGLIFGLVDHGGAYTNFSSVWLTFWIPLAASAALVPLDSEAIPGKSGSCDPAVA